MSARRGPELLAAAAVDGVASTGPEDTERLGAALAERLQPGAVVLVNGELGAGKTTLVRGAAAALGVTGPVTSPTFGIGHRYRCAKGLLVAHLDLYRLADLEDEDPALLEDYLDGRSYAFVEWPAIAEAWLADAVTARVEIAHAGGDRREVHVRWSSSR